MEIAQTNMMLPTIPSGAAIANPLELGTPTDIPAASKINIHDAMNKLVRKCCNVTHPSIFDCGPIGQNLNTRCAVFSPSGSGHHRGFESDVDHGIIACGRDLFTKSLLGFSTRPIDNLGEDIDFATKNGDVATELV